MDLDSTVRDLAPRLLSYCFLRTGDASLAEDVAQEALAALVQRWRRHGEPDSPAAFAFTIARRRAGRAVFRRRLWLPLDVVCESTGCRWRIEGETLKVDADPSTGPSDAAAPPGAKPRLSDPLPSGEPVYVIGNGVSAPVVARQVNPQYTRAAMNAGTQGQVDLEFVVLRDGTVAHVTVRRKLSPELDQQAVAAVRRWLFTPARLAGRPVAARCAAQLTFSLRDRKPSPLGGKAPES